MLEFLLGADPELFLMREGKFFSGFGLIEGDKANPQKVDYGAVQVDGMALEFNIDPATNRREIVNNIQAVMATLQDMVPEYELAVVPTAHFGAEYIAAQPLKARELGCNPDFNAYTGEENEKPNEELPFRTGAGHVHVGWTEGADDPLHTEMCQALVKELDVVLGLPSLLLDGDAERREMYGKAGAYRVKSYGVEYRVLSNFWIQSEVLIEFVYRGVSRAITNLSEGTPLHEKYDVESIINTSDIRKAMEIVEEHKLLGGMG